ncbi:MAG: PQQ-binding-like beta-propeller repeat protein [Planctomycetaceae bacterium]|nr:PQQ-binding-like beta-propeller repeat protein [Planctomycetaceae bacterium]
MNRKSLLRILLINTSAILLAAALIGADSKPSDKWPGFLGAGASQVDPQSIPLKWSPTENIAWKTKLPGRGQSSPVIWGGRVFVTAIDGSMKDKCFVTALDLADGHELWRHSVDGSQKVRSNYFQSRSAPTPVVDGERVYAFFETGNFVALTHDGKPVWSRSLTKDFGEFETNIGLAGSLLQTADSVIVLADHEGPSYLAALDKSTGETRWKTDRDSRKSYASPSLVPVGDASQIVVSSDGTVDGYDPATGKLLWSFEDVGGNTSTTPLPIGNGRFLVSAAPGMHGERETAARKSNLVMQIEKTADGFQPKILWQTETMPSFASPMVHQGHAYWVNRAGVIFAFNAETGQQIFTQRAQLCWQTPIGIGDRVYFFGKDGITTVIAAGAEAKVLAENTLWDPEVMGTATLPGGGSRGGRDSHGEHSEERGTRPAEAGKPATGKPESAKPDAAKPSSVKPDSAAKKEAAPATGRPAAAEGGAGRPSEAEMRAKGENRFADPVQYGVAIVNGSLLIRTGEYVFCVRDQQPTAAATTAKP